MNTIYLINDKVEFNTHTHSLIPRDKSLDVVTLNKPASRCLLLLIERQHEIISQQEFFDQVWKKNGTHISANTFYQNISILRRGLAKTGLGDEVIKTVQRQGITFTEKTRIKRLTEELETITSVSETRVDYDTSLATKKHHEETKKATAKQVSQTEFYRFTIRKILVLVFIALSIGSYMYFKEKLAQPDYYLDYQEVHNEKNCHLFAPVHAKNSKLNEFIKSQNYDCLNSPPAYYYFTMLSYLPRVSVLKCNVDLNKNKDAECISYYYRLRE